MSAHYIPRDVRESPDYYRNTRRLPIATMTDDYGHECAQVRVLPCGGGGNILCGPRGYAKEMAFRRDRIRAGIEYDLPAWESLKVYFPEGGK